jgi:serine O-acetyltransferase
MILSKKDYKYFLQEDKKALNIQSENNILSYIKELLFPNLIWKFEKRMRKCEYLLNVKGKGIRYILAWYFYQKLSIKLGFWIPLNCFGPGLSIAHYGAIIVNPAARIGKNCRLHACINIGASAGNKEAPQLGDNVYIGPAAILFGNIVIGNNVTIGANATVNKSFLQEDVVIAGTPAKIVKEHFPVWWKNNKILL